MRKIFVTTLIVFCMMSQVEAAQDLLDAYEAARTFDPQRNAARFDYNAALEKLPQASAELLPSLSFDGRAGKVNQDIQERDQPIFGVGDSRFRSTAWNFQARRPVFRWSSWVQRGQAKSIIRQSFAEFTKRRVVRNEELYRDDLLSAQEKDEMETDALMAELELAERNTQVEIRWIRSPFNGVVVERFKGPGEYVQEAEIMELAQINPLNVEVIVPVRYYGQITRGMRAEVRPLAPVGGVHEARVKVIDKVIDAASGTFGVRLQIPNPGNRIPAGLGCEVQFSL